MPTSQTIAVSGLRDLSRAFAKADRTLKKDLRVRLAEAAEPVRADAQNLAAAEIRNLHHGDPWVRMRVGVTTTSVYVAPRQRGATSRARSGRRRPNLKQLLLDRAMEPALAHNRERIVRRVDDVLDHVGTAWEHA